MYKERRNKKMNAENFFNFNNTAVNKEPDLGERVNDSPISELTRKITVLPKNTCFIAKKTQLPIRLIQVHKLIYCPKIRSGVILESFSFVQYYFVFVFKTKFR